MLKLLAFFPIHTSRRSLTINDLRPLILLAACYFSPSKVNELKPTTDDVDSLAAFPFLKSEVINGLKSKLPEYLAAAEDVSDEVDVP